MQADVTQEVSPQAATALISHLREHPEHARRSAGDLARDFGLSESFVHSILEGLQPPESTSAWQRPRRVSFSWALTLWQKAIELFDRATRRPALFVAVTTTLAVIAGLTAATTPDRPDARLGSIHFSMNDGAVALLILLTLGLHMVCYYRRRMARYALYGAIIVWMITAVTFMVGIWMALEGRNEAERFVVVTLGGMGMFFVSLLYAGMGSVMAVAGGWMTMKLNEREQGRMSRQEMLERYFQLQSRLHRGQDGPKEQMPWAEFPLVVRFQKNPCLWSFVLGAALSLVQVLIIGAFGLKVQSTISNGESVVGVFGAMFMMSLAILNFLGYIGIGFFSTRVTLAFACSLMFSFGSLIPILIPIGDFGPDYFINHLLQQTVAIPLYAVVSGIAALGAVVEQRAMRERRLQLNDKAAIIAEMLRIQWKLADHTSHVCVMVVDAAQSSVMKAEADPLAVEYSFREYQEWLESISNEFGGRIHSTAGDGAVVSFETCEDALQAARRIQSDLPRFNQESNQLKSPFRLRIGLHIGPVRGNIDEVQFTEVIDIAAHVQEVAPISGIAVTDDVAASLPQEQVVPLAVDVDGHRVFLVMQPGL